ncbi:hypothetical protein [Azospirillum argentinense]|uniref:Uncharacterized protein n=1 Tax=Azospirillum argentinense TaxID=2970906 RepID=A0A5B0KR84_9PROT|nr:hypothetical protein [Azospirillum argentinense]KAA1055187.1 hypothetical protein FH063_005749 [Azospirillum argentinense]
MASDNRSADRNDLDSMTREFLAKGGKIVQCPPGSSDSVVYKRTSFRRRGAANAAGKDGAEGAAGTPPADAAPAAAAAEPAQTPAKD